MVKKCYQCGGKLPANPKYFYRNKASNDGFQTICKECTKVNNRKYYKNNQEKAIKYSRAYYMENKEQKLKEAKEYYEENRDDILEYHRKYKEENKEEIRKQRRKYRQENRKEISEYNKRYRECNQEYYANYGREYRQKNKESIYKRNNEYARDNPEKTRMWSQRRKARKAMLPHSLSEEEWEQTLEAFDYSCAYCGHKPSEGEPRLHQEHFIPVSHRGGYTAENIIPACKSCNSSKHTRGFFKWYPGYKHYDRGRESKILEYLEYEV